MNFAAVLKLAVAALQALKILKVKPGPDVTILPPPSPVRRPTPPLKKN